MTYTAIQEHIGGSASITKAGAELLPATSGPGCARMVAASATSIGGSLQLPDATLLRPGHRPSYVIHIDEGSEDIELVDDQAGTVIAAMAADNYYEVLLAANGTAAGTWIVRTGASAKSSGLAINRQPLTYRFSSPLTDFNLLNYATSFGWDGESPVALVVEIAADNVAGATHPGSGPAFVCLGFPAGSTLLLIVESDATISGTGGGGGRGGDEPAAGGLLPQPGSAGGTALSIAINCALVNYGYIQGGGGGGGGGSRNPGVQGGGGGGGGAGQNPSWGGGGGNGGGSPGLPGTLFVAGGGGNGGNQGGAGGSPGTAGTGAGAAGGAAGYSIVRDGSFTYNEIRAGTQLGPVLVV